MTNINTTFNEQPVNIEGIITNTDINITVEQMASIYVDKHYIHNQIKSSNVWTIQHNLDKYPSVIIADSSNNVVMGDIAFIDKNSIIVSFMAEFSGKAYLN